MNIYIPHHKPMLLIDKVVNTTATSATCEAAITKENIFYDAAINGINPWIGIEYMAQTAGVFAFSQSSQVAAQLGFLLSVRKYRCNRSCFQLNDKLIIIAENEYLQDNIGVFQCSIVIDNEIVATAKLNALQPTPEQATKYLSEARQIYSEGVNCR